MSLVVDTSALIAILVREPGHENLGKGRGTEGSVLNYGDLFAYALAKARNLPLLYKGDDFGRTDIRSAG